MDFSFQALVQQHASQMDAAFRSLVDTIVRNSRLNIGLLRISNVTEDSFHVSLEARITKTGPASASITAMTVDLCGPSGHFGKVTLPAITTQAYGTDVVVTNQLVHIIDKDALKAFIRDIIRDGAVLSLRDGQTTIAALGVGPREMVYEKDIALPGMNGPAVRVHVATIVPNDTQVTASPSAASLMQGSIAPLSSSLTGGIISSTAAPGSGNTVSVVLRADNPSPLEISFGTCFFDIKSHEGKVVAELKGRLDIRCKHFEGTFQGHVNKAIAAKLAADMREAQNSASKDGKGEKEKGAGQLPHARLVGRRCAGAGWCDETIKVINVPLGDVRRLFVALGMDDTVEEPAPENKGGGFTKWTQRLMMR
ncbi:hypothetical protein F4802DRAFT_609589 [Xylaria palmicola]|nr:hypothetical protein F4802DRAFT_609589 [Xylaria palmicola]